MKVLILEDDPNRIEWFSSKLQNAGIDFDITKNPQKAIQLLQENEYTNIFLDHDLAPEHYLEDTVCNSTTGLCVAEWLVENYENNSKSTIIIHSMNPSGSERMHKALLDAKRIVAIIPYPVLRQKLIVKPNAAAN